MPETQKIVPDDAPSALKSAGQAADEDVEDARQARDTAWNILDRRNWRRD